MSLKLNSEALTAKYVEAWLDDKKRGTFHKTTMSERKGYEAAEQTEKSKHAVNEQKTLVYHTSI